MEKPDTKKKNSIYSIFLAICGFSFVVTIVYITIGKGAQAGVPFVTTMVAMALYVRGTRKLRGTAFTFWVFAFLAAAMYFPRIFTNWGFNTIVLVTPLIQLIMFGMGTKLSVSDFAREFKRPKGILVGTFLVFSVMPVAGLVIAKGFGFRPEVAAGVILIGSCPGGVASNVMTFLANGNVALSVSITAFATLMSPIVTPILMKIFAGRLIDIPVLGMMLSILNLIIVPIVAGLIANKVLYGKAVWLKKTGPVLAIGLGCIFLSLTPVLMGSAYPEVLNPLKRGLILGFALIGVITLVKLIVVFLRGPETWMNSILPLLSMLAILLFVTIVVAHYRDDLLVVGLALIGAAIIHNFAGYLLGYWVSRAIGLSERDCRTMSIEVGLKNGGMGMGLALNALKSPEAAFAPIIFGKWMNISGSALANYWRQKPTNDNRDDTTSK